MKKILFASLLLASLPAFSADDAKPIGLYAVSCGN